MKLDSAEVLGVPLHRESHCRAEQRFGGGVVAGRGSEVMINWIIMSSSSVLGSNVLFLTFTSILIAG